MNGFTKLKEKNSASQTFIELISKTDKKGRALISADLRRQLRLKFGSKITAKIGNSVFEAKVDERGRFSVPANIRDGRGSVVVNIGVCGTSEASSKQRSAVASRSDVCEILARGPNFDKKEVS